METNRGIKEVVIDAVETLMGNMHANGRVNYEDGDFLYVRWYKFFLLAANVRNKAGMVSV